MEANKKLTYPTDLNPFGEDLEGEQEYPDYLSPFGEDADANDYDDSLNPFGQDDEAEIDSNRTDGHMSRPDESNPFDEENEEHQDEELEQANNSEEAANEEEDKDKFAQDNTNRSVVVTDNDKSYSVEQHVVETSTQSSEHNACNSILSHNSDNQPESLEPPKPLPRTKSLLKKEQRNRQLMQQQLSQSAESPHSINQSQSGSFSNLSNSALDSASVTSLPREKKKRNAPPVPINYKRQVSGSLEEIEAELNDIGDKLAAIEKESILCQESLKTTHEVDETQFGRSKAKYIELIKRKTAISRRQKELMYRKRELKLDQIHSDLEYELRMIGNKQLSSRTPEDDSREKELLKKLVEIVEEKNDIVENLNKESLSDSQEIDEAFRRLNINNNSKTEAAQCESQSPGAKIKKETCDKNGLTKLSKLATLLPKGGTIKGTMKLKRKHLFKKSNSHNLERYNSSQTDQTS